MSISSYQDWKKALIAPAATLRQALGAIDDSGLRIALVVNVSGQLVGTVTDGDIRRGILHGALMESAVEQIMYRTPTTIAATVDSKQKIALMRAREIEQLPVVDDQQRVIGVETLGSLLHLHRRDEEVVLMAGGLGRRLKNLTQNTPKPLLSIGGKPILETIIESFMEAGFHHFTISLGYLAEKIVDHFGDGKRWGVRIRYVHEQEPLGTAGALSLLDPAPSGPFIVMNADVLTKVNFHQLLSYHCEHAATATMCVRGFSNHIPYGVVTTHGVEITGFQEKPVQTMIVNAGIYVLEPEALRHVPKNQLFDMPSLFDALRQHHHTTVAFPIHEYWMDVGNPEDFLQADEEFNTMFGT